jgi:integrase
MPHREGHVLEHPTLVSLHLDLGPWSLRHSYRSWLDAAGTPIAVQEKPMWHSDIRTTLNVHGDVVTEEMAQANSKVAKMALSRAN